MRFIVVFACCSIACGTQRVTPSSGGAPSDLTGIWKASFIADSGGHRTEGVVALFESRILADSFGFRPVIGVTQGTYDVDFRPLGFALAGGAALQPAASSLRGDSVEVILNPYVGHGGLVMKGVRHDGIVTGGWANVGPGGARGGFELRPLSKAR